ncbi:MAG: hypothetical protein U1C49_00580 [Candidatus Andersenbacteria bacterium]|nr:hypothetical protein [bacterium]MDZ4225321.1 hypothetical protein [Candidatus Andersenbacteria bacterium]
MSIRFHRSTIVLAILAVALGAATVLAVRQLIINNPAQVKGISVAFGVGGIEQKDEPVKISGRNAVLWDMNQEKILFEQNAFERRPIASITKLMTAMVALDHGIDWDKTTTILPEEYLQGGTLMMQPGETATMKDLFNVSLLGSANNTMAAFVRELGVDEEEFIREMNRKAIALDLEQTKFTDVTGLDPDNVSTAYEVAKMAAYAFKNYPEITQATSQQNYTFVLGGSGREHMIKNTNKLISEQNYTFLGSKTGYLYEAAYCLVVRGSGEQADRIAVVLDSPSEQQHFNDIASLINLPAP